MAENADISHLHYHFGHFVTPYRHVRITKTSLCWRGGSKDWFGGQYVKTCICGRTKIIWNTHRVGVTADNIVRYTASSLTVLRHSLPIQIGKEALAARAFRKFNVIVGLLSFWHRFWLVPSPCSGSHICSWETLIMCFIVACRNCSKKKRNRMLWDFSNNILI